MDTRTGVSHGDTGSSGSSVLLVLVTVLATGAMIPVYRLQDLSWAHAAAAAMLFVVPCVLLGWLAWRRLARTSTASPAHAVVAHLTAALLFSSVWTLVFSSLVYCLRRDVMAAFVHGGAVWQFVWGILIYAGLAVLARAHIRARERALAAANAELHALRAQLNPHFLFNTLHSLAQLAREDSAATQRALEQFGELMCYVLAASRVETAEVPLEEELRFVRNYLAVEALRLGERLRVVENIDADALEMAVPPLVLQPLVENAVRHGLSQRRQGGTIRLSARLAESTLALEVADDGAGAEPDAWRRAPGFGLKAVARQLEASYPAGARLHISTRPHEGFMVQVEIPKRFPVCARA
jgi:signal transduction histidine kinase